MDDLIQNKYLEQIEAVLKLYNPQNVRLGKNQVLLESQKLITLARAVIERISGTSSSYYKQVKEILTSNKDHFEWEVAVQLIGVLESLKHDIKLGYMQTFEEWIHDDIFGDFLEKAKYLLDHHFKDAAAVIAGSTLEAHLRHLCMKHGITITTLNKKGESEPKRSCRMNDDLTKIYGKTEQKAVTLWLDIRNNAAHGHYEKYTEEQVRNMIEGIIGFTIRNPA